MTTTILSLLFLHFAAAAGWQVVRMVAAHPVVSPWTVRCYGVPGYHSSYRGDSRYAHVQWIIDEWYLTREEWDFDSVEQHKTLSGEKDEMEAIMADWLLFHDKRLSTICFGKSVRDRRAKT